MPRLITLVIAVGVVAFATGGCRDATALPTAPAGAAPGAHLVVRTNGSQPAVSGPAENFTGAVVVTPLFQATETTRASGASVTFAPGARSAWHSHPAGQTLIVDAGMGWVQEWGGPKLEIRPGDVVWTPAGVKHWHGATPTSQLTHTAIQEQVDGRAVDWMEHVGDEQYRGGR